MYIDVSFFTQYGEEETRGQKEEEELYTLTFLTFQSRIPSSKGV